MKKVLFFAAMVAALSMAFVACGKKENKAAEGEEIAAPAPAPAQVDNNADLREYYVSAFEAAVAAGDYEKAYQISMEADQKVNPEDFTPEQVQRVMNAAALIPQDFIESKGR